MSYNLNALSLATKASDALSTLEDHGVWIFEETVPAGAVDQDYPARVIDRAHPFWGTSAAEAFVAELWTMAGSLHRTGELPR